MCTVVLTTEDIICSKKPTEIDFQNCVKKKEMYSEILSQKSDCLFTDFKTILNLS